MLLNRDGRVFVGQRLDHRSEAWQMPQGGIDAGEEPEAAALRELEEETGIPPHRVEVVARCAEPLAYDLPAELAGTLWKGRYRGQRQHWFLCRFLGDDSEIDLATPHPEFRAWRWADPDDLPALIVPFKRKLYQDVLEAFRAFLPLPLAGEGRGEGTPV